MSPNHIPVRGERDPGIKLNSKVVIFNNHLASIYFKRGRRYDYIRLSGDRRHKMCDSKNSVAT